eukprot:5676072-Amphidinium_carterae.1
MGTRVDAPYVPLACVWRILDDPHWLAKSSAGAVSPQDPLRGYTVLSRRAQHWPKALPAPPERISVLLYSQHALYTLLNSYRHTKAIRNNAESTGRNLAVSLAGARLRTEEVQSESSKIFARQKNPPDDLHILASRAAALLSCIGDALNQTADGYIDVGTLIRSAT